MWRNGRIVIVCCSFVSYLLEWKGFVRVVCSDLCWLVMEELVYVGGCWFRMDGCLLG